MVEQANDAAMLPRDDEVPTIGELQRVAPWFWLSYSGYNCSHGKPVGVAAFVIRWGADTSSNRLPRTRGDSAGSSSASVLIRSRTSSGMRFQTRSGRGERSSRASGPSV